MYIRVIHVDLYANVYIYSSRRRVPSSYLYMYMYVYTYVYEYTCMYISIMERVYYGEDRRVYMNIRVCIYQLWSE